VAVEDRELRNLDAKRTGRHSKRFLTNIREAIERFLETLSDEERAAALSRETLITAIEVQVYSLDRAG